MYFKIKIPEPCGENWHDMTPTEQGKFCANCEKEVIDFSNYTNSKLATRLKNGEKLCGKFKASQLDREIFASSEKRNTPWKLVASFTTLMAMAGGAFGQEDKKPKIEQRETTIMEVNKGDPFKIIKGNVTDYDGLPLPAAAIELIGTDYRTTADFDGNYQLEVPIMILDNHNEIKISYVGYLDLIKSINNTEACVMRQDLDNMQEVIVVGGAIVHGIKISRSFNSTRKPRSRWMRWH